jgi:hypothetical protein
MTDPCAARAGASTTSCLGATSSTIGARTSQSSPRDSFLLVPEFALHQPLKPFPMLSVRLRAVRYVFVAAVSRRTAWRLQVQGLLQTARPKLDNSQATLQSTVKLGEVPQHAAQQRSACLAYRDCCTHECAAWRAQTTTKYNKRLVPGDAHHALCDVQRPICTMQHANCNVPSTTPCTLQQCSIKYRPVHVLMVGEHWVR